MKSGTFLEDYNNLGLQEIEIDELLTAVTESCAKIQRKGNVEEAGRPIVVSMEKPLFLESQESSINCQPNNSVQKLPGLQAGGDNLEPDKVPADPRSVNLGRIETAGSRSGGECSVESGNETVEISSVISNPETNDCLPSTSKPSDAGEEIEESSVLASQKRKKSQENQPDESSSDVVQKRKSLRRNYKKSNYCEITDASESESEDTSDTPLNGKLKKNLKTEKNPKTFSETMVMASVLDAKKKFGCAKCGKKFEYKPLLNRHLQTHNPTSDLNCRICGKAFKVECYKQKHEKIHTAPKVRCQICGNEFKNSFALHCHRSYMHSNQKSKCLICQKIFASKKNLREHEKKVHKLR
jgi:hypothetical protein